MNTKAFVSDGAFMVDGAAHDAVITANYQAEGGFTICVEAIGCDVNLVLDEEDIRWVREHLGIGQAADSKTSIPRTWVFTRDDDLVTLDEFLDQFNDEQ